MSSVVVVVVGRAEGSHVSFSSHSVVTYTKDKYNQLEKLEAAKAA